jgi:hypothetical protein
VVLKVMTGGESTVFVNDVDYGGNSVAAAAHIPTDFGGREITLTRKAKDEDEYNILVESYAWHGACESGGGLYTMLFIGEIPSIRQELQGRCGRCCGVSVSRLYTTGFALANSAILPPFGGMAYTGCPYSYKPRDRCYLATMASNVLVNGITAGISRLIAVILPVASLIVTAIIEYVNTEEILCLLNAVRQNC